MDKSHVRVYAFYYRQSFFLFDLTSLLYMYFSNFRRQNKYSRQSLIFLLVDVTRVNPHLTWKCDNNQRHALHLIRLLAHVSWVD